MYPLFLSTVYILVSFICPLACSSLEHKDHNVLQYLNQISEEQEEKTQILEHIVKSSRGTYIDLGTGGDSIAYLTKSILPDSAITLIASDKDVHVLNSIAQRHPELTPFIHQQEESKLRVKLLAMDATNMAPIKESSIAGISASALAHEVFSYVPTKSALDQLFIEIARVLEPEGVFVYRDPKWDTNPYQDCLLVLKESMPKLFVTLFLPRFLDTLFSQRVDYRGICVKPALYDKSYICFNVFTKGSHCTTKLSLQAFINTPTTHIDFSRNISIEAPRGLISEIQRHYILFMKNIFITDLIEKKFFEKEFINKDNLPNQEKILFNYFLDTHGITESLVPTSLPIFDKLLLEKKKFYTFIENGLLAKIKDVAGVEKVCKGLYAKGISSHLIHSINGMLWADPKVVALLFHGSNSGIFNYLELPDTCYPAETLEWLKREGEEFYFYKTTDELITYIGQLTEYYLKDTDKKGYLLCPINTENIKSASRNLYKSIIESQMTVMDMDGNRESIIFDKNIIHFKLMQKQAALTIYRDIIKKDKQSYPQLKQWIEHA